MQGKIAVETILQIVFKIVKIAAEMISAEARKGKEAKKIREQVMLKEGAVVKLEGATEKQETDLVKVLEQKKVIKPAIEQVADDLGVETNLIKAFISVESGKYHKYDGKLVINYEAHYFKKSGHYVPDENIIKGDKLNQKDEWRNFNRAKKLDEEAAYRSISMGKTQIMGANYKLLGYNSAKDMFQAFDKSEDNAIYGFGSFVKANSRLHKACKEKDYHHMAYYYNGPKYKEYADRNGKTYADKIREAYKKLCA